LLEHYRERRSLVVRLAAHNGSCPVNLFDEYETRDFVRERPRRQGESHRRLLRHARRESKCSPDQKGEIAILFAGSLQ
jgi:hypothetical protein